jgi:tRNA pseudouridine38-40 synthase
MRLAFRVSYLGGRFYGSQMQAEQRTVEGEFVAACQRLDLFSDWRKAGFVSAGRTDRGVHARGQVIAFTTDEPDRAIETLNLQLPPDCWCTGSAEVPEKFHPRYDAISRTYRYYFPAGQLDTIAMTEAAGQFLGTHNFSNFARVRDKNPYRTVLAIQIGEDDDFIYVEVKAESFLWHQVRCMAAMLAKVGRNESGKDAIAELLQNPAGKSLQPAPAEGLVLWDTDCGISYNPIPAGLRSRTFLDHLIRHHALMEKVCREMGKGPE